MDKTSCEINVKSCQEGFGRLAWAAFGVTVLSLHDISLPAWCNPVNLRKTSYEVTIADKIGCEVSVQSCQDGFGSLVWVASGVTMLSPRAISFPSSCFPVMFPS